MYKFLWLYAHNCRSWTNFILALDYLFCLIAEWNWYLHILLKYNKTRISFVLISLDFHLQWHYWLWIILTLKQKEPAGNKGQEQSNEVSNYFMLSILAANNAALHNFNFTLVLDHAGGGDQLNCMCKCIYCTFKLFL